MYSSLKDKETLSIFSEMFYPEDTSTGYIMTNIALGLTDRFNIKVFTGPASYQNNSGETLFEKREKYKGLEIERTHNLNLNKNNIFTRFFRLLYISTALAFKCLFKVKRNSKVLLVTNPVLLLLFMAFIVRVKKIKLYLIVHDVYPDNMVAAKVLKREHFLMPMISKLFSFCYAAAETVIVLGRDMKEVLQKKTSSKIEIIENWGQLDSIFPTEKKLDNYKLSHLKETLTFLFAGNIGRVQGIEQLCDIALAFKENKEIAFIFAGGGARLEYLEKHIIQHDLSNIYILGSYKREEQEKILNLGDIGIVSLTDNMYGLGVPSKTYNLLAAGKPILYIGDEKSEIARLVKEHQLGWVGNISNNAHLIRTIKIILKQKERIPQLRINSRIIAEKLYSKKEILKKYNKILV